VLEKHGGNITYESVFEMEYLDKVVSGKSGKQSRAVNEKATHETLDLVKSGTGH
jgi:hypothetical protein